ncbi:MAG: extensin family protein [Pseudomonadota bacterium]
MRHVSGYGFGLAVTLALFNSSPISSADDAPPTPVVKPGTKTPHADTQPSVIDPPKQPTPQKASQLKACPVFLSGRVTGRYLPSNLTEAQCGDEAPVEISAVGDVALKPAAQVNCRIADAFSDWVEETASSAHALFRQDLREVRIAASYVCRRRNNAPTGKFSEHATMNAVDVSGFVLEDGSDITVFDHWSDEGDVSAGGQGGETHPSTSKGRFLRTIHAKACERFTTVLGPDGDRFHKDHFHFDLGCHGKTCTWRICQ